MSYKELAKNLIDQIPDSKIYDIVAYLQGSADTGGGTQY